MKNETLEFINEHFETIKSSFINDETQIIEELDLSNDETLGLLIFLNKQMISVVNSLDLLQVINERSLGIDLDNDKELEQLLNMIKNIIK
jgi:chromosome condensin MukBEF MukE localization factor